MDRAHIYEHVVSLIEAQDEFAAMDYIFRAGDRDKVVQIFSHLIADLYYKQKDLQNVFFFGHAGINYCLHGAIQAEADAPSSAPELRLTAKRMATNLASYAWPGWREPGIEIREEDLQWGLKMARFSVRLLNTLEPTSKQLVFTNWFLGAQLLANGLYAEAIEVFESNAALARETDEVNVQMNAAYAALSHILHGKVEEGEAQYTNALQRLERMDSDDSRFYLEQLNGVRGMYGC